jgi:hypothetical protein
MLSPKLNINFFSKKIRSFHFFGVLGYVMGILLGVFLCYFLKLEISVILLMSLVGAATFFLLAILAKVITGEETIVYYHHEIVILLFCAIALKIFQLPVLQYMDITILGIGTFLAFGRIGCFNVGCCHGKPYKHGIKYGKKHVEAGLTWYYEGIKLLPVQLIESAYVVLTVSISVILLLNNVTPGTALLCYTVIYGLMRFVLEYFRGDPERRLWKGVSEAQWTTLILIGSTLYLSLIGYLPFYKWHSIIFLLLVIAAIITIIVFSHKTYYMLFSPQHIKQIAEGLKTLSVENSSSDSLSGARINIYTTSSGLSFSSGYYFDDRTSVQHYTVSSKNNLFNHPKTINRVANLISFIEKHTGGQQVIRKDNGIYHILLSKSNNIR